jgi:hypothetical protein
MALAFPVSQLWSAVARAKRRVPFQDQIDRLRASGIALPETIVTRLRQSGSLESYESDPYRGILAAMADPDDGDAAAPSRFFYLDTETIEAGGDYVALATKMVAISGGSLTATGLKDRRGRERSLLASILEDRTCSCSVWTAIRSRGSKRISV